MLFLYKQRHEKNDFFHIWVKKTQISFAVTAELISAFPPTFSIRNFKLLAFYSDCAGRFVLELVVTRNCCFSHANAHTISGVHTG